MTAFIDAHREDYGVEPICKVLPIAPSTYHAHAVQQRDPKRLSERARRDAVLCADIRRVHEENFSVYGARKVWCQLLREGIKVARCTVERLMRRIGLAGAVRGKTVKTTVGGKEPCPTDKVNRQFQPAKPNSLWEMDITYSAPRPGWSGVRMTGMPMRKEKLNDCLALCCEGA